MPLTNAEVIVLFYFRSMGLTYSAVQEILHLKLQPLTHVAENNLDNRVSELCHKEQQKGYPALRHSSGEWNSAALNDFLGRKAMGLSDHEQWHLIHIGEAEQAIIDRNAVRSKGSERRRARKHDAPRNGPGHGQSSKASSLTRAHTTGFTTINQCQPNERPHASDIHSPRRPRHELSPTRSDHYQTSNSSTATNFQSPYDPIGYNGGRHINNQPAYSSATFSGGYTNADPPLQSLGYCHVAPRPHSDYHAGWSDREGGRRSTRPTQTSGHSSITPHPSGPRDPSGRKDMYF